MDDRDLRIRVFSQRLCHSLRKNVLAKAHCCCSGWHFKLSIDGIDPALIVFGNVALRYVPCAKPNLVILIRFDEHDARAKGNQIMVKLMDLLLKV